MATFNYATKWLKEGKSIIRLSQIYTSKKVDGVFKKVLLSKERLDKRAIWWSPSDDTLLHS